MTPLFVEGAELFKLADALLQLGQSDEHGASGAAPSPGFPKFHTPVKQGRSNGGRGEGTCRLDASPWRPSRVLCYATDGKAGLVQGGPVTHEPGHFASRCVPQDPAFRDESTTVTNQ